MKPSEDFKKFNKINALYKAKMTITQKLHGTNALIYIYFDGMTGNLDLICGSRTRWITPQDDNYGFAKFIHENKEEFIDKLGEGYHYGEWVGFGINSGEGLDNRNLILFDWQKFHNKPLPERTNTIPVLYHGEINFNIINEKMEYLKNNGSELVKGFMNVEGIVIDINGVKYKKVFNPEETKWISSKSDKKMKQDNLVFDYLLQHNRLENLLSKDERYLKEFPKSIGLIINDYTSDLLSEEQIDENIYNQNLKKIKREVGYFVVDLIKSKLLKQSKAS
ncbi:hypothetical protein GCL60_16790 [Silvanigrella paludirubra]|uniref:Uncharacterized protein n=1 Tax=Silvanigrella paludirubra TaxID=2499159 RepID=A0A6N6VPC6_9BACT|nr:RNA ligase family protein [Silvanigrella paludirubra]KAB8035887.1 hypothetical protein GCL60_16790 [Silvanigrella paludirubra]